MRLAIQLSLQKEWQAARVHQLQPLFLFLNFTAATFACHSASCLAHAASLAARSRSCWLATGAGDGDAGAGDCERRAREGGAGAGNGEEGASKGGINKATRKRRLFCQGRYRPVIGYFQMNVCMTVWYKGSHKYYCQN